MKKILIIQTAFIGDVILATALIEKLAASFPGAQLDFLLRKGNESLLANNPHLKHVWIWDKKQNKLRNLLSLSRKVKKQRYDLIVNAHRFASSGIICAMSGAKEVVGFDKNPLSSFFNIKIKHQIDPKNPTHETERNQKLIAHITDEHPALPRLYPAKEDFEKVRQTEAYVTLSPASVWFTKQLPAERWIDLISYLPKNLKVIYLGGPSDAALCNSIAEKAKENGHENTEVLAGKLSFLQSAALMKNARMNYVNDSAPLHLCSAMDAPVTAFFCSTVPGFGFTPLGGDAVVMETRHHLECRPCGLHGKRACPLGHFKCSEMDMKAAAERVHP